MPNNLMSLYDHDASPDNTAQPFLQPFPTNTTKRLDLDSVQDLIGPVTSQQKGYMHSDMLHLEDYYRGRSTFLSSTVIDQIRKCNSFLIQDILPLYFTKDLNISWETLSLTRTLADYSADQSVPNLTEASYETNATNLVRRGIGMRMDHAAWSTPLGRQEYLLKFAAMIASVREVVEQTTLLALLEAQTPYAKMRMENVKTATDIFGGDVYFFGMLQKKDHALHVLNKEARNWFQRNGVVPDTYIMPPRMLDFAQIQPGECEYWRAGNDARKNLKSDNKHVKLGFGDVFEVQPVDLESTSLEPMNRLRAIGGFFCVRDFSAGRRAPGRSYATIDCNTQIYCAEDDEMRTIGLESLEAAVNFPPPFELFGGLFSNNEGGLFHKTRMSSTRDRYFAELGNAYLNLIGGSCDVARQVSNVVRAVWSNVDAGFSDAVTKLLQSKSADGESSNDSLEGLDLSLLRGRRDDANMEKVKDYLDQISSHMMMSADREISTHLVEAPSAVQASVRVALMRHFHEFAEQLKAAIQTVQDDVQCGHLSGPALSEAILELANGLQSATESRPSVAVGKFAALMFAPYRTADAYKTMVSTDLPLPFSWICFRPRRVYQCGSIIACRRGEELGRTFYGYPDYQWANDAISKTMTGHLTFHHSSAVTNPSGVMVLHDVIITDYVDGENAVLAPACASEACDNDECGLGAPSIFAVPVLDPYFADPAVQTKHGTRTRPLVFGTDCNNAGLKQHVCNDPLFQTYMNTMWCDEPCAWSGFFEDEKVCCVDTDSYVQQFGSRFGHTQDVARFCFQEVQYVDVNDRTKMIDEQGHIPAHLRRPGGAAAFKGYFVHMPKSETPDYYA